LPVDVWGQNLGKWAWGADPHAPGKWARQVGPASGTHYFGKWDATKVCSNVTQIGYTGLLHRLHLGDDESPEVRRSWATKEEWLSVTTWRKP